MNAKHVKAILFSIGILGISTYQIHGNSSGASSPKTGSSRGKQPVHLVIPVIRLSLQAHNMPESN